MAKIASRLVALVIAVSSVLVTGCADEATGQPPSRTAALPDNPPPTIDHTQLAYDPVSRTVHFYDLITDARTGRKGTWEVWLPQQTIAYPRGHTFQIPRGVNEADVMIRASDSPGPPSPGVNLTDVPRKN
jgi:hypothetical protein